MIHRKFLQNLDSWFTSQWVKWFTLFVIVFCWVRQYFGVDLTDESLYVSIPYRFWLGDRPFADEWNLAQLPGLVTYPFMSLWFGLKGDATGAVLFARHVAFFISLSTAIIYAIGLRRFYSPRIAILAAILCLVYVPYNLLGLGYNNLSIQFLLLAIAMSIFFDRWFISGLFAGMAVFVYPTLILSVLLFFSIRLSRNSGGLRIAIPKIISGAILVPLVIAVYFRITPNEVLTAARFVLKTGEASQHSWTWLKLVVITSDFLKNIPFKSLIVIACAAIGFGYRPKQQWLAVGVTAIWFLALSFANRGVFGGTGLTGILILNGFLSVPLLFRELKKKSHARTMLFEVWTPLMLAGFSMAWSSNNGIASGNNAWIFTNLVSLVFFFEVIQLHIGSDSPRLRWISVAPAFFILFLLLRGRMDVYLDDKLTLQAHPVNAGPFRGLYTTIEKRNYLDTISRAVNEASHGAGWVQFIPHFPAGYLFTSLKSAAPSLWDDCLPQNTSECFQYYSRRVNSPALLVRVKRLFYRNGNASEWDYYPRGELGEVFRNRYALVSSERDFDIYRAN